MLENEYCYEKHGSNIFSMLAEFSAESSEFRKYLLTKQMLYILMKNQKSKNIQIRSLCFKILSNLSADETVFDNNIIQAYPLEEMETDLEILFFHGLMGGN